jgi:hypothetical protein
MIFVTCQTYNLRPSQCFCDIILFIKEAANYVKTKLKITNLLIEAFILSVGHTNYLFQRIRWTGGNVHT